MPHAYASGYHRRSWHCATPTKVGEGRRGLVENDEAVTLDESRSMCTVVCYELHVVDSLIPPVLLLKTFDAFRNPFAHARAPDCCDRTPPPVKSVF